MGKYDVIIVGGGASGLAAAIEAARRGKSVAVAERMPRVGKKLLATGNGRCNLTNITASPSDYRNGNFASSALARFDPESTVGFFRSIGVLTHTDGEGRVYPLSNTAASVLDALRFEASCLGAELMCDTKVTQVELTGDGFILNGSLRCDRLIIAAGGKASPAQGSDGSGFELLRSLGHTITPLYPSLVRLNCGGGIAAKLKGIRARAALTLVCGDNTLSRSSGEVLFTERGISGIAAMDISRDAARMCQSGKKCEVALDLVPELDSAALISFFAEQARLRPGNSIENTLCGILPRRLGVLAVQLYSIDCRRDIGALTDGEMANLACAVKSFALPVTGTDGFADAQVTSGGVDVAEFDSGTMESRTVPGLYVCGEAVDVDGPCGGYNLQWAWASGRCAGCSI